MKLYYHDNKYKWSYFPYIIRASDQFGFKSKIQLFCYVEEIHKMTQTKYEQMNIAFSIQFQFKLSRSSSINKVFTFFQVEFWAKFIKRHIISSFLLIKQSEMDREPRIIYLIITTVALVQYLLCAKYHTSLFHVLFISL